MAIPEIKWEAPEYEYREKGAAWYWASIIVAAAIVVFAVLQKNFLFGLFIVVAEILFITWGNRPPRTIPFTLNADGITAGGEGGKSYSLKEFESMSVNQDDDDWAEIIFVFRAKLKSPFRMLIPAARLTDLRAGLRTILRETAYEPTFIDSIEKLLRF